MIWLRFSPEAWKKLHAALNTETRRHVPALVEEYFRARGWTVVQFHPVYVGLSPYRVGRLEVLLRPRGEKPWNEQPVYAVVCKYSDDGRGIVASVSLAELPRNADEPQPLPSIAQSLVKRLSNVLRALPVEHLNDAGSQTGAGACAEISLNPHGSGHETGSRQNAPSQSPTGDCDGADSPPPQDGSPDAICANKVARATVVGCNNPAGLGSETANQAAADAAERAEPYTDADDAAQDAPPFCAEATSGDALSNLSETAEEAPRESSTVPSAGAVQEDAAVRQSRRNILRNFKRGCAVSNAAHREFGGQFASIRNCPPDPVIVQRLRQIFARLALQGGESAPGPRWDARKVALKTASYLRPWSTHDRRLEEGRPAILVLPDVSGSMGKFADEVTALAGAVAELGVPGGDIIVAVHSNGYPIELKINRGKVQTVRVDDNDVLAWYASIIARYEVRLVLIAGDWDGEWLYQWLASRPNIERLAWLDVYCSSYGEARVRWFPPRRVDDETIRAWEPYAHKVWYADRCSTAADCVHALEHIVRR